MFGFFFRKYISFIKFNSFTLMKMKVPIVILYHFAIQSFAVVAHFKVTMHFVRVIKTFLWGSYSFQLRHFTLSICWSAFQAACRASLMAALWQTFFFLLYCMRYSTSWIRQAQWSGLFEHFMGMKQDTGRLHSELRLSCLLAGIT